MLKIKLTSSPILMLMLFFFLLGCNTAEEEHPKGSTEHIAAVTSAIDDQALIDASESSSDWLSYGLNYAEDRFSKLDEINTENVSQLGTKVVL